MLHERGFGADWRAGVVPTIPAGDVADLVRWLTNREREVAEWAALGATNRQIADQLVVSIRTVEGHLLRAFVKLGVRNRAGLAKALGLPTIETETDLSRCHNCGAARRVSSPASAKARVANRA